MKYTLSSLLILFSLVIFGMRIVKGIELKQNVTGYLKRAADANTIDLAAEELSTALRFIEKNNLTSGYTSIIYQTPDEDLDFWYRNLKTSLTELQTLKSESALEKTNVLIKPKETLLNTGKKTSVTIPQGLAVFPNNKLWAFLMSIAVISFFSGFLSIAFLLEKKAKK